MFCPKCGNQNPEGTPYCGACGAPLNAAPQQPQYTQPMGYTQPAGYAQPVYTAPNTTVPGKGMGITGMILGIVALVMFCYWVVSIPCAIVGAILAGVALNKAKQVGMKNGMATAGLVCSCIALGLAVLYLIFIGALLAELGIAIGSLA